VHVTNKLIYSHLWRSINRKITKVTLIEQIQRDKVTQMYIDTTGVWDCVRNKALVFRRNDAMHRKCQLGRGMWISENECARDYHKYS